VEFSKQQKFFFKKKLVFLPNSEMAMQREKSYAHEVNYFNACSHQNSFNMENET
jgi:hypothetical protein